MCDKLDDDDDVLSDSDLIAAEHCGRLIDRFAIATFWQPFRWSLVEQNRWRWRKQATYLVKVTWFAASQLIGGPPYPCAPLLHKYGSSGSRPGNNSGSICAALAALSAQSLHRRLTQSLVELATPDSV